MSIQVVWIETWRSQDDLDAHMETSHVKKFLKDTAPLIVGDVDAKFFTVRSWHNLKITQSMSFQPIDLNPPEEKIKIFATVKLRKDASLKELYKLMDPLLRATRAEPGCIKYAPNHEIGSDDKHTYRYD